MAIVTYIWHPILLRPITIWLHMIHGAQHILWFRHDALESLEFEQPMWLTTFDYYLFHVYLFEHRAAVILDRLHYFAILEFIRCAPKCKWHHRWNVPNSGCIKNGYISHRRTRKKRYVKNVSINLNANSPRI